MAISIPQEIQIQLKKSQVEQILRAECTSVHDTLAGGFTVGIKRAGQENPDTVEYRYLGPAPTVGDDVLVFRVGSGYIVAGIDETVLDRQMAPVEFANTVAEVELYSFTVPANTMSLARGLRLLVVVSGVDPAGTANWTFRYKFNGVTIFTSGLLGMLAEPGSLSRQQTMVANRGAANSQVHIIEFPIDNTNAVALTAVDTTQDVVISATGQMDTAGAGILLRVEQVLLERK